MHYIKFHIYLLEKAILFFVIVKDEYKCPCMSTFFSLPLIFLFCSESLLCLQVLFCLKFGFVTCTTHNFQLVYSVTFGHCVCQIHSIWSVMNCLFVTLTRFKWLRFFDVDWNWVGAVGGGTRLQAGQSWFWFPAGADCLSSEVPRPAVRTA